MVGKCDAWLMSVMRGWLVWFNLLAWCDVMLVGSTCGNLVGTTSYWLVRHPSTNNLGIKSALVMLVHQVVFK